ncbi:MAG: RsmB/NOP family class I SAM-dependent RNA methyltransferase [Candidatus Pacearchaeota archaeon]
MTKFLENPIEKAKPLFIERMKLLLKDREDYEKFCYYSGKHLVNSIRCNTLKIPPEELKKRLEKKWKIRSPFSEYKEIMIIDQELSPGELGNSIEHILGYYYIQEISSMMPILTLKPDKNEIFLDIASSPGSKTTQAAAMMENQGTIIANEINLGRIMPLATNLQRCGVTNTIITKHDGAVLCNKLKKINFKFDKILLDAPCSGEGTIRSSPKTVFMFSENLIKTLAGIQKKLLENALKVLKVNGEIVYSTCTHAPEENESVVSYILENYPVKIEDIQLPKELKTRSGIPEWKNIKYHKEINKCVRIYPQDNDTEGFFIAKLKKLWEIE